MEVEVEVEAEVEAEVQALEAPSCCCVSRSISFSCLAIVAFCVFTIACRLSFLCLTFSSCS